MKPHIYVSCANDLYVIYSIILFLEWKTSFQVVLFGPSLRMLFIGCGNYICIFVSFPPMNIGCVNHICVLAFFAPAPPPLLTASHWKWLMAFRPHSECTNPWIQCRCQIPLAWLPTNKQSNQNQATRFEVWSRSDLKENVPPELCLQQGVISSPGWTISRKVCRSVPLKAASCLLGGGPWWSVCYTTLHCHH